MRICHLMRCLSITPRPGMKARVRHVSPYDFPDELNEGDEVTVMSFSTGFCEVRDLRGRELRLFIGVDCGTLYEVGKTCSRPIIPEFSENVSGAAGEREGNLRHGQPLSVSSS